MRRSLFAATVGAAFVIGSSAASAASYIIVGTPGANLDKAVKSAGGVVTNRLTAIDTVIAESNGIAFKAKLERNQRVQAVVPNVLVRMIEPIPPGTASERSVTAAVINPPNNDGSYDSRYALLWGLDAVNAPEAWAAGVTGEDVRVAVLDGGFNYNHPDLAPNVNLALSRDMTGEGLEYGPHSEDPDGIFSHGTHVAGTIAAAKNGTGVIGVAPDAELVLVKVLFNYGSGSFEDLLEGILYAADVGADVINMSLGADIPQGIGQDSRSVAALRAAMSRAISYAYQKGATVVVAAGNDGRDLDKDQSVTVFPAQMNHAIAISATAPIGWGVDPTRSLDNLASYSNYGRSVIDFAAPGGDYMYAFVNPAQGCLVGGLLRPCYIFDYVYSTGGNVDGANYNFWSVGTSMATPHAAGVAALIISENGGSMHPAQVKAEMARRAVDLGQPGNDPAYGTGRLSSGY